MAHTWVVSPILNLFINSIIAKHKQLEGLSQASAEYQVLQIVTTLENYGVEWHSVRDSEGQKLLIGVGPEGISICKDDFSPVNRYVFCGTISIFHFSKVPSMPLVFT